MTRVALRRRLAGLLLAVPVVLLAVLALGIAPASAHASLDSTSPDQGSELSSVPPAAILVFSEDIGLNGQSLEVADPRGHRVDDGRPRHEGKDNRTVEVTLPPGLGRGSYTVTWRVVSADGHPGVRHLRVRGGSCGRNRAADEC